MTPGHTGGTVLLGGEWGHTWSYWRHCAPGRDVEAHLVILEALGSWAGCGGTPGHTGGTGLLDGSGGHSKSYWRNCAPGRDVEAHLVILEELGSWAGVGVTHDTGGTGLLGGEWGSLLVILEELCF